jgi:hypothetical protein
MQQAAQAGAASKKSTLVNARDDSHHYVIKRRHASASMPLPTLAGPGKKPVQVYRT